MSAPEQGGPVHCEGCHPLCQCCRDLVMDGGCPGIAAPAPSDQHYGVCVDGGCPICVQRKAVTPPQPVPPSWDGALTGLSPQTKHLVCEAIKLIRHKGKPWSDEALNLLLEVIGPTYSLTEAPAPDVAWLDGLAAAADRADAMSCIRCGGLAAGDASGAADFCSCPDYSPREPQPSEPTRCHGCNLTNSLQCVACGWGIKVKG